MKSRKIIWKSAECLNGNGTTLQLSLLERTPSFCSRTQSWRKKCRIWSGANQVPSADEAAFLWTRGAESYWLQSSWKKERVGKWRWGCAAESEIWIAACLLSSTQRDHLGGEGWSSYFDCWVHWNRSNHEPEGNQHWSVAQKEYTVDENVWKAVFRQAAGSSLRWKTSRPEHRVRRAKTGL